MWESGGGHRRWGWYAGGVERGKSLSRTSVLSIAPPLPPSTSPRTFGGGGGGRVVSPPLKKKKELAARAFFITGSRGICVYKK